MDVRIISYSKPATYEDNTASVGSEISDLIAYCARVSNPSNQANKETNGRLLKYLSKHKHWSPFEMASVCLEVTTTRDIARQILRHRSFSFQEFSQRYADVDDIGGDSFVTRIARLQDVKNRQNSIETENVELHHQWIEAQEAVIQTAKNAYEWAINNGIAKEQARAVLPEGCTVSRLYINGTIRSWIHYVELRAANGTQKEHMDIAVKVAEVISKIFPDIKDYC